jgi:hypothetical protein
MLTDLELTSSTTMDKKARLRTTPRQHPTYHAGTFAGINMHCYASLPVVRHGPTFEHPNYKQKRKIGRETQGKREFDMQRNVIRMVKKAIDNKSKFLT